MRFVSFCAISFSSLALKSHFMFLCTHRHSNLIIFLAVEQKQAQLFHDQSPVGWGEFITLCLQKQITISQEYICIYTYCIHMYFLTVVVVVAVVVAGVVVVAVVVVLLLLLLLVVLVVRG